MILIEKSELVHSNGSRSICEIKHGWDLKTSLQCDTLWKQASLDLLCQIMTQNYEDQELAEIISSILREDDHWEWFAKAMAFRSEEYKWFHLFADDKPQAACVIYHPKQSALHTGSIFYIEFVAVAPWNRACKIRHRDFLRVGSTLVRATLRFAVNELKLQPGFCLHSLPGANGFYKALQMINVPEYNKDEMLYFELSQDLAKDMMEIS